MATGDGVVVKLQNLEKIEGADRIVQARLLGETIIVGTDQPEGSLGVLFDIETKLMHEFLSENNLYRHSELNKDKTVTGYFDDNGRVRPIRLRGVKVSGFWTPLESLAFVCDPAILKEGDLINTLNGHTICKKYLPEQKGLKTQGAVKRLFVPMFKEHFDTDHLLKSLRDVPDGASFILTKKLHGTSARYGKLLVDKPLKWYEKLLYKLIDYKPQIWANVVGSRTVVKSIENSWTNPQKGYYDNDLWTNISHIVFGDRLLKGETVYFEIVGYDGAKNLMPPSSSKALESILAKDEYKEFVAQFGEHVEYNYGCPRGEWDVYVYRITHTTVDGESIDLAWEQVKRRCEQLGVKHVPEITTGAKVKLSGGGVMYATERPNHTVEDDRDFSELIEKFASEAHHNGTHAEGICLRVDSYPTCKIWKHKCQNFKIMEFGLKDMGVVSIEEQETVS